MSIQGYDESDTMLCCNILPQRPCIGIFSPSEPITESRSERLEQSKIILRKMGFTVKVPEAALQQYYYMAGKPHLRIESFMNLLSDASVDLLWASWGGKSTNQLLRLLDFDRIGLARKPILAFSDGCVLLNAIAAKSKLITFSGPNIAGKAFETQHADLKLLRGIPDYYSGNLLGIDPHPSSITIQSGVSRGRLVGGNLSTFVLGLIGSTFMPRFKDMLFFWESAGETPQIIDQHLNCLRNGRFFENVRGMIVGDFIRPEPDKYKRRDPLAMISDTVGDLGFPILYCPIFGHLAELENPILPIGALCEMNANNATLRLLEPVVQKE